MEGLYDNAELSRGFNAFVQEVGAMQNRTGLWEVDKGAKEGKGVGQTMAIVSFKVLQLWCTFKLTF